MRTRRRVRRMSSRDREMGERVWAIVYSAWILDPKQRGMLRMQGVPSIYDEATREADKARYAWITMIRAEDALEGVKQP